MKSKDGAPPPTSPPLSTLMLICEFMQVAFSTSRRKVVPPTSHVALWPPRPPLSPPAAGKATLLLRRRRVRVARNWKRRMTRRNSFCPALRLAPTRRHRPKTTIRCRHRQYWPWTRRHCQRRAERRTRAIQDFEHLFASAKLAFTGGYTI